MNTLRFDGLGRYDIKGSENCIETSGRVFVNGAKDAVKYTLNDGWKTGSFVYEKKNYTFSYDSENDTLTVTYDGSDYSFSRKN